MILIIDDGFDIVLLISTSIEKLGLFVISFTDPLEALKELVYAILITIL